MDKTQQALILEGGVKEVVPPDGIKEKLNLAEKEGRPLVVKLGFDPTAPDLHLGHAVVLRKLREFQDLGHRVVVIIGDFTARIGDPTGKNKTRPPLTPEQVQVNTETYLAQLAKVLDPGKLEVRFNSEWFDKMDAAGLVRLLSQYTLARILERDDFKNRYRSGAPVALHELVYPLLQGFDSFQIEADVEIGGSDQLFNSLVGRTIQEARGRVGQIVLSMPLLRGTDGEEKMSKSLRNAIGVNAEPNDMYGKVMSIPDALLTEYIDLATQGTPEEKSIFKDRLASGENPMKIKKEVAYKIVQIYNGDQAASEAQAFFERQFQKRDADQQAYKRVSLESLSLPSTNLTLTDLCCALQPGKSKTFVRKNLIQGGAVKVDGVKIEDPNFKFEQVVEGTRLTIGKLGFYEINLTADVPSSD